jgi:hypothetical protein
MPIQKYFIGFSAGFFWSFAELYMIGRLWISNGRHTL